MASWKLRVENYGKIKSAEIEIAPLTLFVGDNNSGKTTFLEAVQLLFTKSQLSSVKSIIKQRTVLNISDSSFYTSFISKWKYFLKSLNSLLIAPTIV